MKKIIRWIPYIIIMSLGFCYIFGFPMGIGVAIPVGIMMGITMDKARNNTEK